MSWCILTVFISVGSSSYGCTYPLCSPKLVRRQPVSPLVQAGLQPLAALGELIQLLRRLCGLLQVILRG